MSQIVQDGDGYVIELAGWELNSCTADRFNVFLDFACYREDQPEEHSYLAVGGALSVELPDGRHELQTTSPDEFGPLLSLLRGEVRHASVDAHGTLEITLSTGAIEIQPHAEFEAWDLMTPGFKVVCMPGGDLAIWDGPQPTHGLGAE